MESDRLVHVTSINLRGMRLDYAREHFKRLNELQNEQRYHFKFLSPVSYDLFFKALKEGTYKAFRSELEAKVEGQDLI